MFREVPYKGKTKRFNIISKSSADILGRISWYSPWRQYCFTTFSDTVWNKDCLTTVETFIKQLMNERKILSEGKEDKETEDSEGQMMIDREIENY